MVMRNTAYGAYGGRATPSYGRSRTTNVSTNDTTIPLSPFPCPQKPRRETRNLGALKSSRVLYFFYLWTRLIPKEWAKPRTNVRYHLGRPQSHRLGWPLALQFFDFERSRNNKLTLH